MLYVHRHYRDLKNKNSCEACIVAAEMDETTLTKNSLIMRQKLLFLNPNPM